MGMRYLLDRGVCPDVVCMKIVVVIIVGFWRCSHRDHHAQYLLSSSPALGVIIIV